MGTVWVARADRLIEIPTGRLVYPERAALELGFLAGTPEQARLLLNFRVANLWEVQGARTGFDRRLEVYGVQYSLYPEIPGYAPGVALGITDIANRTTQGRGYYLAISYGIAALGRTPLDHDLRVHLGFGAEGAPHFFIGFDIPLNNYLFLRAEYLQGQINAALAWRISERAEVQGAVVRNRTSWSIMLRL
ncbi:MAG: hypothetical protein RMJ83_08730 [Armatimonadota bacterium]|nr:hypothetical protein [Armatimonadota bacterium]